MDTRVSTYLRGFKGFGRSYNRSVLAKDELFHQRFKEALDNGSLQCNRLRILTIGDKGVGKSSTLKYLQGEVCDPTLEPKMTEGIEITACEVSEQRQAWMACDDDGQLSPADDPTVSAAWFVCADVDSMGGTLHQHVGEKAQETTTKGITGRKTRREPNVKKDDPDGNTGETPSGICRSALTQMQMSISAILMFVIAYHYAPGDFGILCWLAMFTSHQLFFKSDFNSAYRFVTPVMLQITAAEAAVRADEYLTNIADTLPEDSLWLVLAVVVLYSGLFGLCTAFGLLSGLGCRSGVAIAFCLMIPKSKFSLPLNKTVIALVIGNFSGPLLVRFGIKPMQVRLRSLTLAAMGLFALLGVATGTKFQVLAGYSENMCTCVLLLGASMGLGHAYAVLKARGIVATRKLMLPYYLKKGFGFVAGIALGHLIGWQLNYFSESMTPFSVFLSLVAASGFLIYDLRTAQEILRLEKDAIPITTFRKFLMASATGDNPVSLKLHLWDNGGDSVYQSMQQFFRPTEAVYLLVFSLEDARQDEEKQLQRLRQWLFTIKAQSKRIQDSQENEESDPNTLIFVVGTHRDSVSKDFLSHFAGKIDEALYKDFCCILAINGDKGPLYVVENSKVMDQDGIHLRSSVIRLAKKTSYMKELFPIRHLRILNKVRDRQSRGLLPWIMKISDLLQDIAEENMSVAELQQVLVSLHRTGDVIYRYDDQVLNRYVVVSPGVLMDVLQAIVSIPQRESRKRSQARDWLDLETKGIVSQNLIQTIVGPDDTLLPCLRLMEAYNLLIPVYSSALMSCPQTPSLQEQDTDPSQSLASGQLPNYCILPSHLPDFTGEEADFWVPAEDDEVYIFDFKHVSPKPIFHRLLAKLWCERDIQDSKHESVFKTRGRFRLKGTNLYVVRLQQITCSQNTIEVTIHHNISNNRCNLQVLQYLRGLLEEIRCMDFPELPYTCGPICDTCSSDGLLKILKICGHDEAFPIANMQCKAFMQEGRYHEVHLTPQLKVTCGKRRTSSCVSSDSACSLTPRDGRSSSFINELVVGENSDRMTVIGEVHNSTFNMQRTEASPYDTNAQNSEGTKTRERAGDTLQ